MAFLDGGWCFGGGRDLGFAMVVTKKLDWCPMVLLRSMVGGPLSSQILWLVLLW